MQQIQMLHNRKEFKMTKSIFKEIIIVLLLCLAIILVLGIILYEYVPISKTVPSEVAYTTPEEAQKELVAAGSVDQNEIVMTYEVNSDDLNTYRRIQDYKPGKANPFSSYQTSTEGSEGNTSASSSSASTASSSASSSQSSTSSSSSTGETSNTSGGQFFKDKGTK